MPYIDHELRVKAQNTLEQVRKQFEKSVTPGELNFLITSIANEYIERKGVNYTHYNDVVGVLECVKQEFYRRAVTPYEETKIRENGDIRGYSS